MAEKQQLTVAELLARAEKENPDAARRSRRRRRSLEEGGVTVAELTDSFKKVDVKPNEVKHSAHPIDKPEDEAPKLGRSVKIQRIEPAEQPAAPVVEKPAAAEEAPEAAETPEVKQPAEDAPSPSNSETTVLRKVEFAPPAEDVAKPEPVEPIEPVEPATNVIPVVKEPVEAEPVEVETVEAELVEAEPAAPVELDEPDPDVRAIEVEEASINPILMVLLVFIGVLVGVLGFLAFQWLWANTSTVVAVLLGVVTVAAVVFGVRAMRTGRDGLTMALAGLAAAVMAFGPALI